MNQEKVSIYDIEVFPNLHTNCIYHPHTNSWKDYIIHPEQNNLEEYLEFLATYDGYLVGYNNLAYDYPVIHDLIKLAKLGIKPDITVLLNYLYKKSKSVIDSKHSSIKNPIIDQIDLFTIKGYTNKNKSCSLKQLEISLRLDNVEECSIGFDSMVTLEQISDVLIYNRTDVGATAEFYKKCIKEIEFREDIIKKYEL